MKKIKFLTIFTTFGKLDIVEKTLQSVVDDTNSNDAAVIVFDSTNTEDRAKKWDYLLKNFDNKENVFLILSSNTSLSLARNTCLYLGQKMFMPDFICMIDDDHGFKPGMITKLIHSMDNYYGKTAPNNLKFGLFTGCNKHRNGPREKIDNHLYPSSNNNPGSLGGTNGCFRCAPTQHWNNVLNGYSIDEYLISYYQSGSMSINNYNRGFTTLIVDSGNSCFSIDNEGRGDSTKQDKRWDDLFTASDKRAKYRK